MKDFQPTMYLAINRILVGCIGCRSPQIRMCCDQHREMGVGDSGPVAGGVPHVENYLTLYLPVYPVYSPLDLERHL